MTNEETRAGRIQVAASIGALSLTDLTPSAARWPTPIALTSTMGPEQPALTAGKIAQGQYVHYSPRERAAAGVDADLQVTVGRIELVAGPRFLAEVVAYVYKSALFRSNFSALWAASASAASRVRFRHRLDAAALSSRYQLRVKAVAGGINILCPESSAADNCLRLVVPPITVENGFVDGAEACKVQAAVRLSTVIKGVEDELISFDLAVSVCRQLSLEHSSPDTPVMGVDVQVGGIAIAVAQPQVALIWRSAFSHVAEVKVRPRLLALLLLRATRVCSWVPSCE